jgi:dTDP-4-amino-4,6-dideoxygalactose transaminase
LFAKERLELPVTEAVAREVICLPIHAGLETGEVEEIVSLIKDYLGGDVGP